MKTYDRITAGIAAGAALAAMLLASPDAKADPVQEDQPGWSCVDDGNHMCGPGNANGVPAGCYDDGGVLVASWPCRWEVGADGYRYLFTSDGEVQRYLPTPTRTAVDWLLGTPTIQACGAATLSDLMIGNC